MVNWYWSRFFSKFFGFPLLMIIPPLLHNHISAPRGVQ
jgi:hypothetical protein